MLSGADAAFYLEEPGDGSSSTLVPVHPSHKPSSLDVGSTSVISDALETRQSNRSSLRSQSRHGVKTQTCRLKICSSKSSVAAPPTSPFIKTNALYSLHYKQNDKICRKYLALCLNFIKPSTFTIFYIWFPHTLCWHIISAVTGHEKSHSLGKKSTFNCLINKQKASSLRVHTIFSVVTDPF